MSLNDLKHNIQSLLEAVEKHDSIVMHSKDSTNKRQQKRVQKELEHTKDFILKLLKKQKKLIEHERREIKA